MALCAESMARAGAECALRGVQASSAGPRGSGDEVSPQKGMVGNVLSRVWSPDGLGAPQGRHKLWWLQDLSASRRKAGELETTRSTNSHETIEESESAALSRGTSSHPRCKSEYT